ncbi:hypothetical protein GOBAR_AA04555 [Gossypium barbadense]|uniref:Uncharacterized protein n=1 Tax=Gossypium barbadense TaxID=3634 RepID=A0A2P5YKB7_GOSBA|nr:hypothetical protein GOBAR_AA04555 [Gossypium barbadense]
MNVVKSLKTLLLECIQRCQHMKPPHELDERVVVAESVGPRAAEGHHQKCPRTSGIVGELMPWSAQECRRLRPGPKCASTSRERNNSGRLAGGLTRLGETGPCRDYHNSSLRSEDGTLSIVPS